jgi:hypothetical protein
VHTFLCLVGVRKSAWWSVVGVLTGGRVPDVSTPPARVAAERPTRVVTYPRLFNALGWFSGFALPRRLGVNRSTTPGWGCQLLALTHRRL